MAENIQVGDVVEVKLLDGSVRRGVVNWAPEHCLAISFDVVIIPRTYEMTVLGRYGQDDDGPLRYPLNGPYLPLPEPHASPR